MTDESEKVKQLYFCPRCHKVIRRGDVVAYHGFSPDPEKCPKITQKTQVWHSSCWLAAGHKAFDLVQPAFKLQTHLEWPDKAFHVLSTNGPMSGPTIAVPYYESAKFMSDESGTLKELLGNTRTFLEREARETHYKLVAAAVELGAKDLGPPKPAVTPRPSMGEKVLT